jgi:hypothetical protein
MVDNGLIQTLLSAATVFGIIGYGIVNFVSGHREFKKDVYDKLGKKVEKEDCREYRKEDRS